MNNISINNFYLKIKPTHIALLIFYYINNGELNSENIKFSEKQTFYKYSQDLYEMGLLEKVNSKKDERIVIYRLNEKGYKIAKHLYEIYLLINNIL